MKGVSRCLRASDIGIYFGVRVRTAWRYVHIITPSLHKRFRKLEDTNHAVSIPFSKTMLRTTALYLSIAGHFYEEVMLTIKLSPGCRGARTTNSYLHISSII